MRNGEPGWLASLLGAAVLIAGGFGLGLIAGVVSEEPELVVGHWVGRSDEVDWTPEGQPEFTDATRPGDPPADFEEEAAPAEILEAEAEPLRLARVEPEAAVAPRVPEPTREELPAVAAPPPPRRPARDVSSLPTVESTSGTSAREPGGFAVQVGAFAESAAAARIRDKLVARGFDTYVVPASGDGKWRVRVGPVSTRGQADALAARLKSEERLPTWVLSEGGG